MTTSVTGAIDYANIFYDEPDRATVKANGIVVDVVANEDGSVYVECYAYERGKQAVVQHAAIDRYTDRHPNIRLDLADRP